MYSKESKQRAFFKAIKQGNLEAVKELLHDEEVDPTTRDNYALCLASEKNNLELIELLLNDKRIDPSVPDNFVFYTAAKMATKAY